MVRVAIHRHVGQFTQSGFDAKGFCRKIRSGSADFLLHGWWALHTAWVDSGIHWFLFSNLVSRQGAAVGCYPNGAALPFRWNDGCVSAGCSVDGAFIHG